jgi:Leucine-rich repeat (LRR) protein
MLILYDVGFLKLPFCVVILPVASELESLRHLRELKADYNKIVDLDGLQNMDGLVKLSLQGNLIQSMDLSKFKWSVAPLSN